MIGALLAVTVAVVFGGLSVAAAAHARSALRRLAPPETSLLIAQATEEVGASEPSPALLLAEIAGERRGAFAAMDLLLLRFRSAARVALAAGAGSAVLALGNELAQSMERAILSASLCFALGGLAAGVVMGLGHAARGECRRFHDEWNRRQREATRHLAVDGVSSEWTDP